jgi:hypothetical protein
MPLKFPAVGRSLVFNRGSRNFRVLGFSDSFIYPPFISSEIKMSYLPSSPDLENFAGILAKYPRRGILLFKLLEDIKGSFSPLGKGMRELIIAYTSDLNQSESCYMARKSLFKELGIDESAYGELKSDIDTANIDEKLKPLLRFVKKLTLTPDIKLTAV